MPGQAGQTGYPDYQRVTNWDAPQITEIPGVHGHTWESPVRNVSKYANLSVVMKPLTAETKGVTVGAEWFADEAATVFLAVRSWTLLKAEESPVNDTFFIRIPNMGPYVRIVAISAAGNQAWSFSGRFFADNRDTVLPTPPERTTVMAKREVKIPANSTVTFYPGGFFAGPMRASFWANVAPVNFLLEQPDSATSEWHFIGVLEASTLSKWEHDVLIAPIGDWRVTIKNASAEEATAYLLLSASATGAT